MVKMREVLLNGRWPLVLPSHRADRSEWTTPPYWEPERLNAMYNDIEPGDVIFDIGAEEGDMTALFASWSAPSGGVVPFEPSPRVWPNIRAIWDANRLRPPLGIWVGFAGNETRLPSPKMTWDGGLRQGWPESAYGPVISDHGFAHLWERPDIPAIRLDDYAQRFGIFPTVLTMDVEGSELEVLKGAFELLHHRRPLVYASVHPDFMNQMYNHTPEDLLVYMEGHGYTADLLAIDHEHHYRFSHPEGR